MGEEKRDGFSEDAASILGVLSSSCMLPAVWPPD